MFLRRGRQPTHGNGLLTGDFLKELFRKMSVLCIFPVRDFELVIEAGELEQSRCFVAEKDPYDLKFRLSPETRTRIWKGEGLGSHGNP